MMAIARQRVPISGDAHSLSVRYGIAEAERLAGLGHGAARRWLGDRVSEGLTFSDLASLIVVAWLRRRRTPARAVREVLTLANGGTGLSVRRLDAALTWALTRRAAITVAGEETESVRAILDQFDIRDDGFARWWPLGRDGAIVVDPSRSFGRPIIARRGVAVDTIAEALALQSVDEVAASYALTADEVRSASASMTHVSA